MSLHLCKDAPYSGATHSTMPSPAFYPGHDALPRFLRIFSNNSDNYVETNCTSERFFDGSSISRRVKTTTCVG
jgi:hypothetical protein